MLRRACLLLTLAAGCYSPQPALGAQCSKHGDECPDPLVCTNDRCVLPLVDGGSDCGTHDEDGDGIADTCDNCPVDANANQTDGDADGVGDACDPNPSTPGDSIAFFDAFGADNDPAVTFDPAVDIQNDHVHATSNDGGFHGAYTTGVDLAQGVARTHYTIKSIANGDYHSAEVIAQGNGSNAYRCNSIDVVTSTPPFVHAAIQQFVMPFDLADGTDADNEVHTVGETGELTMTFSPSILRCQTTYPAGNVQIAPPDQMDGGVGVGVQNMTADFDYLIVYTTGNAP